MTLRATAPDRTPIDAAASTSEIFHASKARPSREAPASTTLVDYQTALADRLRHACEGHTIAEISRLTEVNHESARRYLRGHSSPTPEFLARLCKALGVSAEWMILGGKSPGSCLQARRGWSDD